MIKKINREIKRFFNNPPHKKFCNNLSNYKDYLDGKGYFYKSFSQCGEDMILNFLFYSKKNGVYVDIGAHHPYRYSNTHKFYKKGWRGINIDPVPGFLEIFNSYRKGDINLELAIAGEEKKVHYFMFEDPAYNFISDKAEIDSSDYDNLNLINKIEITAMPLHKILDKYLKNNTKIDFLNIDAEGLVHC